MNWTKWTLLAAAIVHGGSCLSQTMLDELNGDAGRYIRNNVIGEKIFRVDTETNDTILIFENFFAASTGLRTRTVNISTQSEEVFSYSENRIDSIETFGSGARNQVIHYCWRSENDTIHIPEFSSTGITKHTVYIVYLDDLLKVGRIVGPGQCEWTYYYLNNENRILLEAWHCYKYEKSTVYKYNQAGYLIEQRALLNEMDTQLTKYSYVDSLLSLKIELGSHTYGNGPNYSLYEYENDLISKRYKLLMDGSISQLLYTYEYALPNGTK